MTRASPFEQDTTRLRLRRPTFADLAAYTALHTDPRTYAHAPASMPDADRCRVRLESDVSAWEERGFGYLAVEELITGRVVGWGGVRQFEEPEVLNLYYRLAHDALGRGFGRELARSVVAAAVEAMPERRVVARVKPHNLASVATARSAGLVEVGAEPHSEDEPDDPPSLVLEAPRFSSTTHLDDALREEILDLWVRVNDAGGAVGFKPGTARDEVARVLGEHEAGLVSGHGVLALLRSPADGSLLGLGFWERHWWWGYAHILKLWRLMVDPGVQGRNTGRILMAGMHGLARTMPGVELLRLDYRSGEGVGDFYARLGWVETGRQPLGLGFPDGDRRDDVQMARLPDGGPLVYDGRT
ncbi:MAG: GNAT family N-acetyltransferase [Lapillicoccus sp.]